MVVSNVYWSCQLPATPSSLTVVGPAARAGSRTGSSHRKNVSRLPVPAQVAAAEHSAVNLPGLPRDTRPRPEGSEEYPRWLLATCTARRTEP